MRLPVISGQVSALSSQLGHECCEHLLDLDDTGGESSRPSTYGNLSLFTLQAARLKADR